MKFKDSDLTPIYPPEVKPVRVGLYMASHFSCSNYLKIFYFGELLPSLYWDGKLWRHEKNKDIVLNQNLYWRGLNRDPRVIAKERGE